MQLHKILSGASFILCILGLAGTTGAIETGTGYLTSTTLFLIGIICGIWAGYESGYFRRR